MSQNNQKDFSVFESQATYYNPVSRRWKEGVFRLNKSYFEFKAERLDDDFQFHLSLPLSTISGIEKRQSSFIYAAVVVTVGSEKHWFASFPNRDTVYNLFELFWRGTLFSNPYKTIGGSPQNNNNTPLGRELINLLHDSESTLVGAANALVDQGHQLSDANEVVEGINEELTTAEKIIRTMNIFPSLANMKKPKPIGTKEQLMQKDSKELEIRQKHYKVTFTFLKSTSEKLNNWEKGTLIISQDILLLDDTGSTRLCISRNQLTNFKVVSPWELQINHTVNKKPESFNVMCPQLSGLLKFFSVVPAFKNKVIYEHEETSLYKTPGSSNSSMVSALSSPTSPVVVMPSVEIGSLETQLMEELLSDQEVTELSTVLSNLQALALEVLREQKSQVEKINSVILDVDNTVLRIEASNKNIKKVG